MLSGMNRRQMISASAAGLAAASAVSASAAAPESAETDAAPTVNITGVSLPVIADGRLRNYVFVGLKLNLKPGKSVEEVRAKEAWFRDAIVRTAHRAPFSVPGDWNRLHEGAIKAAMVAIGGVVMGPGVVAGCEVVSQSPRQRVANPTA